ncbi:MAG TPA: methylated-DNA--[protein]-cysteine S-methyltransferase [Solirubrobacteraceae bacterium]|jgi:methylated-DNA-[protein]-cysteine S-methyltransferase|nr:methylated-DNA--[protein]-cysteine S-methyltransferase [Solirubrobacteraceae bacterium]
MSRQAKQTTDRLERLLRAQDSRADDTSAAAAAALRLSERASRDGLADISYASVDSPFGPLLLAVTGRGLARLAFPEEGVDGVLDKLAARISPRIVEAAAPLDAARRELDEYFAGRRDSFDLALDWTLVAPFARLVLGATARIPYGGVLTYSEVAAKAGSPRGSRAAGNALGANPIPIVVPCHRVLRRGGALGGYAGGLERKRFLLELERGRR